MEVYNKDTCEIINLTCVINSEDIARDVIKNYEIDNCNQFKKYGWHNNDGEICYAMESKQIKYWSKVFALLIEIEIFRKEIENKYKDLHKNLKSKKLCCDNNFNDLKHEINLVYYTYANAYSTIQELK